MAGKMSRTTKNKRPCFDDKIEPLHSVSKCFKNRFFAFRTEHMLIDIRKTEREREIDRRCQWIR